MTIAVDLGRKATKTKIAAVLTYPRDFSVFEEREVKCRDRQFFLKAGPSVFANDREQILDFHFLLNTNNLFHLLLGFFCFCCTVWNQ